MFNKNYIYLAFNSSQVYNRFLVTKPCKMQTQFQVLFSTLPYIKQIFYHTGICHKGNMITVDALKLAFVLLKNTCTITELYGFINGEKIRAYACNCMTQHF